MHDFWNYNKYRELAGQWGLGNARIITALAMFYGLDDSCQFIRDAIRSLTEDGIFIAQLMCLASMLEKNDVGNICHEHLEYYLLELLKHLFEMNGLEIFMIEENDVNGGSYRIHARHYKNGSIPFDEKFTIEDL